MPTLNVKTLIDFLRVSQGRVFEMYLDTLDINLSDRLLRESQRLELLISNLEAYLDSLPQTEGQRKFVLGSPPQ